MNKLNKNFHRMNYEIVNRLFEQSSLLDNRDYNFNKKREPIKYAYVDLTSWEIRWYFQDEKRLKVFK